MSNDKTALLPATETFLRSTPELKYPTALAGQFPHIANRIAELSADKGALRAYFEELTVDTRGGRTGFAFDVLMDIQDLREKLLGDVNGFVLDDTTKWVS